MVIIIYFMDFNKKYNHVKIETIKNSFSKVIYLKKLGWIFKSMSAATASAANKLLIFKI